MSRLQQETLASCAGGAILGGITGRIVGFWFVGTVIGALSGAVTGARHVYDWKSSKGIRAFVVDHTWALATTSTAVVAMGINEICGAKVDESLTRRQNRMTFDRGLVLRRGFAVTFGYVVNGVTDRDGLMSDRRRKLVTHHEDVHIRQARMFGPFYLVVYVGWFVVGSVIAATKWLKNGRVTGLMAEIDAIAYYRNPFEWYAYSHDGNWPPSGVDASKVWSKPFTVFSKIPSTRH